MLDVHAPHESVHTWKDFLIHMSYPSVSASSSPSASNSRSSGCTTGTSAISSKKICMQRCK